MTAFGTMPWRPLVPMGDGTGGYDSPRMSATELDRYDGHTLTRDLYGGLHSHGPHGVFGVTRRVGESEDETRTRWREGVRKGWYGR